MTFAVLSGLDVFGLVVIVLPLTIFLWRRTGRLTFGYGKGSLTIEDVHDKLDKIQTATDQVNAAVNNVAPGEPTLLERIIIIEATATMHGERLKAVGATAHEARQEVRDLRNLVVRALERKP